MTKRQLYFHVGLPKTGSSALQSFFATNSAALATSGIGYPISKTPKDPTVPTSGNVASAVQIMASKEKTVEGAVQLYERYLETVVRDGLAHTDHSKVLFSSEMLIVINSAAMRPLFERLSQEYEVTIVAFVRDVFDQAISSWKQGVKTGKTRISFDEFIQHRTSEGNMWHLENLAVLIDAGLDVRVLNYDHCKKDVVGAFFNALDETPDLRTKHRRAPNMINESISYRQADQIVTVHQTTGWELLSGLLTRRFKAEKDTIPDPYIRDTDNYLLEYLASSIATVNKLLPADQKLRTQLRSSEEIDVSSELSDEMRELLETVGEAYALQKTIRPVRWRRGLPKDFDPVIYLLLNPDVQATGHDPVKHYLRHGRFEDRAYR